MPELLMPLAAFCRGGAFARGFAFMRALSTACAFLLAPFADLCAHAALGAVALPMRPPAQMDAAEAALALSGSPFPGVIDCLLQRPLPETGNAGAAIHINYPSIGNSEVDEDIRQWVIDLADAFSNNLDLAVSSHSLDSEDFDPEAILNAPPQQDGPFELWGEYRVSRPSKKAVSIAFELWNYTGRPEGNLDILTLNYSLLTGQRLDFVDIFEKPDVALKLMSEWSRKVLEPRLGAARRANMLAEGTAPLVENFSSFTLTPEGICINFQPWQVAPSEAGIQKVAMPLSELLPSAPLLALWDKGEADKGLLQ